MHSGRVPVSCPPGFQGRYTVRPGDSMFLIAQRFGVSLNALIAANPHISNPSQIFPGDVLCVPGQQQPQCRMPASCPPGFQGRYTVQPGDTMFTIAQRFGVSVNALIAANPHISNPNLIFPCDVLCVPGQQPQCRMPASCPPGFECRYTVQPGDTMFTIAQRFGVNVNALIAANPHITNPNQIFPCDVLCVPCKKDVEPPCVVLLKRTGSVISDAAGSALIRFLNTNQRSISVVGVGIPEPSELGAFNSYQARVAIPPPENTTFHFTLLPVTLGPNGPVTWAGTFNFIPGSGWPVDTMIVVRPLNRDNGETGAAVLTGTLANCCD